MIRYIKYYPFTWVVFTAVMILSLMPVPEMPELADVPFFDKWTHMVMYFGQAGAVWLDHLRRHGLRFNPKPHSLRMGEINRLHFFVGAFVCPVVLGGVLEIIQEYCTGGMRSGDWLDWYADTFGVVVMWLVGWCILRGCRNRFVAVVTLVALLSPSHAAAQDDRAEVTMQTTHGKVVLALYNETPIHRDNFLAQVRRGYYDGLLFHRIIEKFMVQCGDSISRGVSSQDFHNSTGDDGYRLPAEIRWPQIFHRRGVLAAAREGDDVNPRRESSPYEFYIVWGKYYHPSDMRAMQERIFAREDSTRWFRFPLEVQEAYEEYGGTPHLDNEYTVFGEVIKGLNVIGEMQSVKTDSLDRPIKDVRIKRAWVSKELPSVR